MPPASRRIRRSWVEMIRVLALLLTVVISPPAWGDEVLGRIDDAAAAYNRRDLPAAISGLVAALNALREVRAEGFGKLLPDPPLGWRAEDVEKISIAVMVTSGGTGASRRYHSGDEIVTLSIMADTPMSRALAAIAASDSAAAAGARVETLNGRTTISLKDDRAFTTLASERVLVRVEGRGITEATLKKFLALVDFAAVEAAGR